jgi:hypothetical protein
VLGARCDFLGLVTDESKDRSKVEVDLRLWKRYRVQVSKVLHQVEHIERSHGVDARDNRINQQTTVA